MDKEQETTTQDTQDTSRWFVDVAWYRQNNRSFSLLAQNYICAKCRKKLGQDISAVPPRKLLNTIKGCCADTPGFITQKLPIMENVFRLFLANGNQRLSIEEIRQQLVERLGDTYRTSPEILSRLLAKDHYYGLTQAKE